MWAYYLTEYVLFFVLHVISTIVFIVTGLIFQLDFFTLTAPGVYILLFFMWGNVQIVMAFFLSTFFARSRTALLVTYLLVVMGIIINVAVNSIFTGSAPTAYFIYPPFAFYRAILVVNAAAFSQSQVVRHPRPPTRLTPQTQGIGPRNFSAFPIKFSPTSTPNPNPRPPFPYPARPSPTPNLQPYKISMVVPGNEVFTCVMALLIAYIVLAIVALYLSLVLPSEFGIQRPWHFPITDPIRWIRARYNGTDPNGEVIDTSGITEAEYHDAVRLEPSEGAGGTACGPDDGGARGRAVAGGRLRTRT